MDRAVLIIEIMLADVSVRSLKTIRFLIHTKIVKDQSISRILYEILKVLPVPIPVITGIALDSAEEIPMACQAALA